MTIAVLIPVYNNKEGLITSLRSICYTPGEAMLVIVDDGSNSPIIESEIQNNCPDFPIHVLREPKNRGIVEALNKGLSYIFQNTAVEFIARLDAGDRMHPERLFKQVQALRNAPRAVLCGSHVLFQQKDKQFIYKSPSPIPSSLFYFRNPFIHPAVMFKTSLLKPSLYPTAYPHCEDYALFWEMFKKHDVILIPETLTTVHYHPEALSVSKYKTQLMGRKKVIQHYGSSALLKLCGIFYTYFLYSLPTRLIQGIKEIIKG